MMPISVRFWGKVEITDTCWIWTGFISREGYGRIRGRNAKGKPEAIYAHRVAYELVKGPIPKGLYIDHLCRNRKCVNPEHLEAVTQRVNILRGASPFAKKAKWTHCIHGHAFSVENTYYRPDNGARQCKTCTYARLRRYAAEKAA